MPSISMQSDYYGGAKAAQHQAAIDAQEDLSMRLEELERSISAEFAALSKLNFLEIKELDKRGELQRMHEFFDIAHELFLPCLFTLVAMSRKTGATAEDKRELFAYLGNVGDVVLQVMARREIEK